MGSALIYLYPNNGKVPPLEVIGFDTFTAMKTKHFMSKLFFKSVRFILGGIIVTADKLFPPRAIKRSVEQQQKVNESAQNLSLYQFASCPFCIKVRRRSRSLSVPLQTRNVLQNKQWHDELENEGGKRKVPCLRIEDETGAVKWLYQSNAINAYLAERFSAYS